MISTDYYAVLNLRKDCTIQEIKSSYKRLALVYHPDRNVISGEGRINKEKYNSDKFKEISEAYQILSDENKRRKYDLHNDIDSLDFKSPFEIFNFFFKDVPKEYLDISNNFIQQLIHSPEKKISQKILESLPPKSDIHQIAKIVSFIFQESNLQNNSDYLKKKKNNQNLNNENQNLNNNSQNLKNYNQNLNNENQNLNNENQNLNNENQNFKNDNQNLNNENQNLNNENQNLNNENQNLNNENQNLNNDSQNFKNDNQNLNNENQNLNNENQNLNNENQNLNNENQNLNNDSQNFKNDNQNINKLQVNKDINSEFKYLKTENIITTIYVTLEDVYKGEVKKIDITRYRRQYNNKYQKEKKTFLLPLNKEQIIFYNEADELPDFQESGDIIINIEYYQNKFFKKYKKNSLWTDIEFSLYEYYVGTSFTLQFLDNRNITIYSGKNIFNKPLKKIKGLGLPNEKGQFGDLYVNFKLQLNKLNLDDKHIIKFLFNYFPPINQLKNNDFNNHQQYLLETETYDSLDNETYDSLDNEINECLDR